MAPKLTKSNKPRKVQVSPSLVNAKKWLQKNDITEVAEEIGITIHQASKVMNGKSTNWAFVEKIIARAEKNKTLSVRAQAL